MKHYCILSVVEVYGVDAIERMLEDLMASPVIYLANQLPSKPNTIEVSSSVGLENVKNSNDVHNEGDSSGRGTESTSEEQKASVDATKTSGATSKVPDPVVVNPNSRIPGDTVMKILMQKVRSLELNLSVLEEYLKELNHKQDHVIPQINKEISRITLLLESGRKEIKELVEWKENIVLS